MRRSSASLVFVLGAMLLWATLPGATFAASRPTRFLVTVDGYCVQGLARDGATVKLDWRAAGGAIKAVETLTADTDGGNWDFCSNDRRVRPGDVIKATVNSVVHQLVIPNLTLRLDRVTNVVRGRAPAGTTVHLIQPFATDVTANAKGKWSYSSPSTDFYGGVGGRFQWISAGNDTIDVRSISAQLIVWIGKARFDGWTIAPKQPVKAFLYAESPGVDPTLTLRGKGKTTSGYANDFVGHFYGADGRRVNIRAGDHVSALSIASDAEWIVPQIDGTANKATNVVNGHCEDTGTRLPYYHAAIVKPNHESGGSSVWGILDGDGNFSIDFDDPAASPGVYKGSEPSDVQSGDALHIWCEQNTGDYAVRVIQIP